MRRWLPWLLGVVVGGACLWFLLGAEADPRVGVADGASRPAEPTAPLPAAREPARASQAADLATVSGRCVAAETGAPLAECRIRLRSGGRPPAGWNDPEEARSAADGRFVVRVAAQAQLRLLFTASHPERSTVQGVLEPLVAGQTLDLGDLVLRGGARVSGQVMDLAGQPVADVGIQLERVGVARGGPLDRSRFVLGARSTGDGSFAFQELVEPHEWSVRVHGACDLRQPRRFIVAPDQAAARLEITVERYDPKDVLAGTVTDEDGVPAVGVPLWVSHHPESGSFRGRTEQARTDPQGRFRIRRLNPDDGPVSLVLAPMVETSFEAKAWTERYRWGTTDIGLRVRGAGVAELLVVEAGTGTPVEDFGLRCFRDPTGGGFHLSRQVQQEGKHPGGRVRLETAKTGRNAVIVYPSDAELVESEMVRFEAEPRRLASVRVELKRRLPMPIQVVTTAGTPLPGARVELLRWEGNGLLTLATHARTPAVAWSGFSASTGIALILDVADTDAEGLATLRGPPSNGTLALKVTSSRCVATILEDVSITRDMARLRVEVAVGATLRGRVVPLSLLQKLAAPPAGKLETKASWPGLRLRIAGEAPGEMPPAWHFPSFPLDPEGRFLIAGIPPGDAEVDLTWVHGGGSPQRHRFHNVRALRDGEVREVELDATALTPVTLRGRVSVNGQALAGANLVFHRRQSDGRGGYRIVDGLGGVETGSDGRFTVDTMPCELRVAVELGSDRTLFGEWFAVSPGADREVDFVLVRRKLTVRVLEADGQRPAAGRWFRVDESARWDGVPALTANGDGVVVVDPAPAGPFHLVAWPPGFTFQDWGKLYDQPRRLAELAIHLDPIRVPEGQIEARCEVRLPAR